MKKIFFRFLLPMSLLLLTLAGCASSERMGRLSGGVVGEYSAPPSHRLRSERFQAKEETFSSATRSGKTDVAGLQDNLVNVWPFYVRSKNYTAVLWPFMDFDPYGLAVRPFYNQEGDDYSILFPLCAWNPVDGDGWVLNTAWDKNSFCIFPLAAQTFNAEDGNLWYTPLIIHSWDRRRPENVFDFNRTGTFTEILLGYYGQYQWRDKDDWDRLFRNDPANPYPEPLKRELAYRCGREGCPVPADVRELEAFRQRIFDNLPQKEKRYFGFFPLFHVAREGEMRSLNVIGPVFGMEFSPDCDSVGLLGWLVGEYESKTIGSPVGTPAEGRSRFFSLPLMSLFQKKTGYQDTPEVAALRQLNSLSGRMPFARYRGEMETELKKIDPALKLPETVIDRNTMRLYLETLVAGKSYPTEAQYSGGFLPLLLYHFERQDNWWALPALLTGYNASAEKSNFWSVPLLTFVTRSPDMDLTTVLCPVGWYGKTRRVERVDKQIYSRETLWADEQNTVEFEDQYALLGLFYRGEDAFYVAREGVDAEALEKTRSLLLKLAQDKSALDRMAEKIRTRESRNTAWKTKTKIEYYRQQIEVEEIALEWAKYREREAEYQTALAQLKAHCETIGFPWRPAALDTVESAKAEVEKLFDFGAELRRWNDWGNGLFCRRERYVNGDYKWHILGILAGGTKKGDQEDTQVLHFLYRFRRDANRTEELIFPFISIQREGDDERVSFLWRVFERTVRDGKTSGHILFIPYGN